MQRRTNLILAAAAAIALLGLTQPAAATVVSHNGTGQCNGSDEVAVFVGTLAACGDPLSVGIGKVFSEVVEHEMVWQFNNNEPSNFFEDVVNQTGDLWLDFHISFEILAGGPFDVTDFEVQSVDADVVRMDGDGIIEFWIFFDEPLVLGDNFFISGFIASETFTTQLEVRQHPSIPEPGSLALFATGLLALALIARRRRRLAA